MALITSCSRDIWRFELYGYSKREDGYFNYKKDTVYTHSRNPKLKVYGKYVLFGNNLIDTVGSNYHIWMNVGEQIKIKQ